MIDPSRSNLPDFDLKHANENNVQLSLNKEDGLEKLVKLESSRHDLPKIFHRSAQNSPVLKIRT